MNIKSIIVIHTLLEEKYKSANDEIVEMEQNYTDAKNTYGEKLAKVVLDNARQYANEIRAALIDIEAADWCFKS